MADSLHDIMKDRSLRRFSSADMVNELAERGVLRTYGVSQYLPGIVRARSGMKTTDLDTMTRGKLLHELVQYMAAHNLVVFETGSPDDPTAPPTDTTMSAHVLTLDPDADLSQTGE